VKNNAKDSTEKRMKNICIGIHVHSEGKRLKETLESVHANTDCSVKLLLLPDGPDNETKIFLKSLKNDLLQNGTDTPLGPPACFNRLAVSTDAEILVLLESGSIVGPGWLDNIIAALDADPQNGLAGPSTNRSWNEQCVFPGSGKTINEIADTAREGEMRFGKACCTLEPLYSLADFCYVVKREVLEAIGAADEAYGLGPCWEMDYNIRAARAGFQGIWACSAYVYRSPFTLRRQHEEKMRFTSSKHRYQDKFCQLKLLKKKKRYCTHCEGSKCKYFAPDTLIEIFEPFTDRETIKSRRPQQSEFIQPSRIHLPIEELPLVSCIMPTHNRRVFIPKAIQYFLDQDYPNCELIIVDDGTDPVEDIVPDDPRINYVRKNKRMTIGAARNLACQEARGKIIIHWDDDDWIANWRISYQISGLLEFEADICGLNNLIFFDMKSYQSWHYFYPEKERSWVAGNTLCFTKDFWKSNPFANINDGEDTRFIWSNRLKKIVSLKDQNFLIGIIHPGNSSPKRTTSQRWHTYSTDNVRKLMGKDWEFYTNFFHNHNVDRKQEPENVRSSSLPVVSCIMPTHNRRTFVPHAIHYFLRQDYPHKELIIVDDGTDNVTDLIPDDDRIKYFKLKRESSIGYMRNFAVGHSKGSIIAHWDDDDWYAMNRISYQVQPLLDGKYKICGIDTGFIYSIPEKKFWRCDPNLHARMFYADIHGGTIVYFKDLWEKHAKFPDTSLAEDAAFLQRLSKNFRILKLPNKNVFIYIRHETNAWRFRCGEFLNPQGWRLIQTPAFIEDDDMQFYQSLK
jgi:glycosyltransferase involved in cell wall biosynthesis